MMASDRSGKCSMYPANQSDTGEPFFSQIVLPNIGEDFWLRLGAEV